MIDKQAILIIMHNNLWTLGKILKLLDSEYFDIFVHIDKKSEIEVEDVKNIILEKSKLFIYKNIDVRWADVSQIECELFLLEKSFNQGKYKYFHLISGVDMPIKKSKDIFNFFNNANEEFIHFESEIINKDKFEWINRYNILTKYRRTSIIAKIVNRLFVIFQQSFHIGRNLDRNYIKTGANWFSISNELSEFILKRKYYILEKYNRTISGDELFLQTEVYNSEFKDSVYNEKPYDFSNCMRLIDWNRGRPYTFRLNDFDELINSECMFARKFDENIDREIIEKLYEKLIK